MDLLVTLTLSDRLFSLLEDKLPNLGRRIEKAVTKELGASARAESNITVTAVPDSDKITAEVISDALDQKEESKKTSRARRAKADQEVVETPALPEDPTTIKADQTALEISPSADISSDKSAGEIIREIMHRTRQRFEGEDYKENTESETYKKYHRALTSQFKQIAVTLGYEKPSYIDDPEKIKAFAAECDALSVDEKGLITPPPPAPY